MKLDQTYYEAGRLARRKGKHLSDVPDSLSAIQTSSWEIGWHHEGVDLLFRKYGVDQPQFKGIIDTIKGGINL